MAFTFLPDHPQGQPVTIADHVKSVRAQKAAEFDANSNATAMTTHTIVNLESHSPKSVMPVHGNITNPYRDGPTVNAAGVPAQKR